MIPTRDSARWIGQFLDAYRELGVEPFYIFDMRSVDDTRRILEHRDAKVIEYRPRGNHVEAGMIEFGSKRAGTEWILRLDDDEFPSQALLQWIERHGVRSVNHGWGLSRRELFKVRLSGKDSIYFSRHRALYHSPYQPLSFNAQLRLYRVAHVKYTDQIHSAGLEVEFCGHAPNEAYFIHCDCIVRSRSERLEKINHYELIEPKSTWRFAKVYLPETWTLEELDAEQLAAEEFDRLLGSISTGKNDNSCPEVDRQMIETEVNRYELSLAQKFQEARENPTPAGSVDIGWAMHFPIGFVRIIAELISTLGLQYGVRLWRYAEARRIIAETGREVLVHPDD